ncbi:MAG: hypothetical protein ICV68_17290, partial [Pyrinomonadaceae bacterium]|nr:hypothetical protein [Pyrinomonadaceae bacterium]
MNSKVHKKIAEASNIYLLFFLCIFSCSAPFAQDAADTSGKYRVIAAGPQYGTSAFHRFFWGEHYRREWTTPVKVPLIYLDTIAGGLIPYKPGGGRQSKTVRLRNASGKEYVLRSIDKTFGRALPDVYRNTFIENIIDDQVSIAHPYAAVTIPVMAEAAHIYHTWPQIGFVPRQPALDMFNNEYGNTLYLLEQRPDENWEEAAHFGKSKNIIGTEKLFEKIRKNPNHQVDQLAYIRARLFDMFIGDWGRHEDQWRWATLEAGDKKVYRPIPRDRDQTYTKFDGALLQLILSATGLKHLQTFDYTIKDVARYNFPARHLDRQLANEPSLQQWTEIAIDLQQRITNAVIEEGVKQLPPELFPISGSEIIAKLKARRDQLVHFAAAYYLFLAKEVDVVGTEAD